MSDPQTPTAPAFEVNINEWLGTTWNLFKQDIVKYAVAGLIAGLVSIVTCGILSGPMAVGLYGCFMKKARGGDFEYGDLFNGVKKQFLPSLLFVLAVLVITGAISVALAFIPIVGQIASSLIGIVIGPLVSFSLCEIAAAETTVEIGGLVDLVKRVFDRIKSQYGMLIVLYLILEIITFLGVLGCCIGVFVTGAFMVLALSVSYLAIFKAESPAAQQ